MFTDTAGGPARHALRPVASRHTGDGDPPGGESRRRRLTWSRLTAWLSGRRQHVAVALLVVTLGLVPVALLPSETGIYAGIATATPTLYTYTVAIVVAGVLIATAAARRFPAALLPWAPFLLWLLALTPSIWDASPRTVSGLLHFCLGAAAFAIGATAQDRDRTGPWLPWLFAAVAWLQLLAIAAAVLGFPLRRITGPQALDVLGRATGLTAHPGELAKLLFFCGLCALTLPQRTWRQRWAAWLTLGAVLAGISLAQSRSVLAAVMSMILIFVLLEFAGDRWRKRHVAMIGITLALGAMSVPWLIERFTADPAGGARQHVARVALAAIADHPWTGVGPNGYVAVVGAADPLTASGVPAHNVFLLSAAEVGIPGALLLWLPFAAVAIRATVQVWRTRGTDPAARILVSAMPALVLIGMTGWGLLQGPYFLILSLVTGYFGARVGAGSAEGGDGLR